MKYDKMVDKLFDESNTENIKIADEQGVEYEFEQVALIPLADGCYAILKNVTPMDGVEDDEAFVFYINEDDDELEYVDDEDIVNEVFAEYDKLFEE